MPQTQKGIKRKTKRLNILAGKYYPWILRKAKKGEI